MKEVEEVSHTLKPVRHLLEEYSEARWRRWMWKSHWKEIVVAIATTTIMEFEGIWLRLKMILQGRAKQIYTGCYI
ncbi:hypothetical protein QLX08_003688 [Tetragonisca angustula]|uniref:Uncharacterized protein n=1 Tax=Tetragonisca angustula TaxID=166442 RepID=A0AAW1A7Z1_9HYME